MELTDAQRHFFETFGFLALPGVLRDDLPWIVEDFEDIFAHDDRPHDGTQRSCIVPFIDQRARLCTLLEHPVIHGLIAGLLGEDFNYLGGDGNFYTGDTRWHSDGHHVVGQYLKVAFYLDPLSQDTGCLRVIPGSHLVAHSDWAARRARDAEALWDMPQDQVPHVALETRPGDVVAFNHNLMHASFGGSTHRRMFTINCCAHCRTAAEIRELENFVAGGARFWKDTMFTPIMRGTASAERMVHLRQVMAHESHLPALAAKARREMAEPARG